MYLLFAGLLIASPINVGQTAPDFSRSDCSGSAVSLKALLQEGPAVVVFVPQGLCVHCATALAAYTAQAKRLTDNHVATVVVYGGSSADACQLRDTLGVPFEFVSDADGSLRELYDIHDARCVSFAINRSGVIRRYVSFSPLNEDVAWVLQGIGGITQSADRSFERLDR